MRVTEKNFASRNRRRQSEFRKQQLIEATLDCIDRLGISQTTLARIADRAGLSQGNLLFHFQSKESLFEQTLRTLSEEYRNNWQNALRAAGSDPVRQLQAMIRASFAPSVCTRKKISVWFAFWGESRSRPQYMRVCGANDKAFSDSLLAVCRDLETVFEARLGAQTAALGIEGMIDGLWQNFLLGPPGFKRDQAVRAVFELAESVYPGIEKSRENM